MFLLDAAAILPLDVTDMMLASLFFGCLRHSLKGYADSMEPINLDSLRKLDGDVINEVVREAERRIDAQLATANAADQRAMAWNAILVTVTAAVIGGSGAIWLSGKNGLLALIGLIVSAVMLVAIKEATDAVTPTGYDFPGNLPQNWLPENWKCAETGDNCTFKEARLEQAATLNEQIVSNAEYAKIAGESIAQSMRLAFAALVTGAVLLACLIFLNVAEPKLKLVDRNASAAKGD